MGVVITEPDPIFEIPIQYDGREAERHVLDLSALGESLQGAGRIIAVCAHFSVTQKLVTRADALDVRVVAREPKENCFSVTAALEFAHQYQLFSGAGGALFATTLHYLFDSLGGRKQEMKHLRELLEKAIAELGHRDQAHMDRAFDTIDNMVDVLRPAAKQAVIPVGKNCDTVTIGSSLDIDGKQHYARWDQAAKERIMEDEPEDVTEERSFEILFDEMDWGKGTCKVFLDPDHRDRRTRGIITDPAYRIPNNKYGKAFASRKPIRVRGKAGLKEGDIVTLYISDTKD